MTGIWLYQKRGPDASGPLFSDRMNVPDGVNMMANTTVLALSLPMAPVTHWLGAGVSVVVLLTLCHGLARMTGGRMFRTGDQSLYPRMELLVSGVWMSALAAILLAVLAFQT